jgi:hypothetical protein
VHFTAAVELEAPASAPKSAPEIRWTQVQILLAAFGTVNEHNPQNHARFFVWGSVDPMEEPVCGVIPELLDWLHGESAHCSCVPFTML